MLEDVWVDKMPWPPPGHTERLGKLARYQRLFEGDPQTIKAWVKSLRRGRDNSIDKEFVPFPAPEIAARTLATFLFGENAQVSSPEVQDEIDELLEDNHLHAANQEAAITCAVEGEIYYKLDWDTELSDQPIISSLSGAMAFPRFRFGRLVEVVFAVDVNDAKAKEKNDQTRWRHVEIRLQGKIIHRLFKGTKDSLGDEQELTAQPETEDLEDVTDEGNEIETEIDDLLVRHVPFWRTSSSPHGISIFRGKDGLIESLHALYTQDQHDAEMAKRRIAVSNQYLKRDRRGRPVFDRSLDLFELSDEAAGVVGGDAKPIHAIEFTDNTVMGQRIAQRLDEFLLACGIAPESAGRSVTGAAESGTARKLAQSLTLQTVATAGRYFSPALRDVIDLGLQVGKAKMNLTVPEGYSLKVEMQDGLVDDDNEKSEIVFRLRQAKAISIEQAVRYQHPEWGDDLVEEEVDKIAAEEGMGSLDLFGQPDQQEEEPAKETPSEGSSGQGAPQGAEGAV